MTVSNLGVCFGPTLLRPEEETVASIMDLKFYNIVVEILIENYETIFNSEPENVALPETSSPKSGGYSKNNTEPSTKKISEFHSPGEQQTSSVSIIPADNNEQYVKFNNHASSAVRSYNQPLTCVSFYSITV